MTKEHKTVMSYHKVGGAYPRTATAIPRLFTDKALRTKLLDRLNQWQAGQIVTPASCLFTVLGNSIAFSIQGLSSINNLQCVFDSEHRENKENA